MVRAYPRELGRLGSPGIGQSVTPLTTPLNHLMLDVSMFMPSQGDIEVQAMMHCIANFMDSDCCAVVYSSTAGDTASFGGDN